MKEFEFIIQANSGRFIDIDFKGIVFAETEEKVRELILEDLINQIGKDSAEVYIKYLSLSEISSSNKEKIIYTRKFFYQW
jgi:hypothetical protein